MDGSVVYSSQTTPLLENQMKRISKLLLVIILQFAIFHVTSADTVTLTPADINGEDTTTTQFSDGSITLTPFIGDTPATFNGAADRLGIDENGTNDNAFNDPDIDPGNNNDERLEFQFAANTGLSRLSWDFSRADGMGGGIFITGFTSNPGATFEGNSNDYGATIDYNDSTGTLNFQIFVGGFDDFDGELVLANPQASAGQTLVLSVADIDQAGAQLAITGITYQCNTDQFNEQVVLIPSQINGGNTNTANFDDGSLSLTPFIGTLPSTFNDNDVRLGIDGNGTNNNAFNDPDTDPNNDNDERLEIALTGDAGLSLIGWDFSRADGEFSGVSISGFVSDPQATLTGNVAGSIVTYDELEGTLTFDILGDNFTSDDGYVRLANPAASQGQTLLLRVADADEAGAQLALTFIGYQLGSAVLLGDVNLDGEVNLLDVDPFVKVLTSGGFQLEADVNQDGQVNLLDVDPFVAILTGG